jgi:hypothetical protein
MGLQLSQAAWGVVVYSNTTARGKRARSHSSEKPKTAIRVQAEFSSGFGDWLIANRVVFGFSNYQSDHPIFVGTSANGMPVPSAPSFSDATGLVTSFPRICVGAKREIWRLDHFLAANETSDNKVDLFCAPRSAELTGGGLMDVRCPLGTSPYVTDIEEIMLGELATL